VTKEHTANEEVRKERVDVEGDVDDDLTSAPARGRNSR
jgi:hypothetical protein